ncbi:uncharacterized protein LOC128238126 [Mya arenaria]|uniref:uncharacterized protein LOC128238126 n=1 Tax=Mya arenaria TaxID=6604 RepID=UPI0022E89429|nr:uncharacterized protein LOC128238126 [Mya arenaria]
MGVTFYKVTGILLSVTVVVLGAVTTIVLYFAGQSAIDFFYTGTTRDVDGRIHRRQPTDDWYGVFFLRDWAFGFVYITPGIYGIASSLFFNKCLMGVSVVVEILAVTAGSFLHTAGALGLLIYYSVVAEGASKHDPFLTDCFFSKMQTTDTYPIQPVPVNERCEQGRKLFALAVGAVCVAFLAWFLTLITLLCRGFLIHHVPKPQKKHSTTETSAPCADGSVQLEPARIRRRRQGMARPVASASDADRQADIGMAEGARPKDGGGAQRTTPEVGIDEKVTMAALVGCTTDSSYVAGSTPEFHLTETSEPVADIDIGVEGEPTSWAHMRMQHLLK